MNYFCFRMLESLRPRVEYLECAGFVLFQCKNKIPRATERQDVLIAKSVSVTAIHHA